MEKNKVARAKKAKDTKKVKAPKPPKQKKEKRSVKKQRKLYEKALKKARPEKMLSIVAIVLSLAGAVLGALNEHVDDKLRERRKNDSQKGR